jgi:hypothetical protein
MLVQEAVHLQLVPLPPLAVPLLPLRHQQKRRRKRRKKNRMMTWCVFTLYAFMLVKR